MILYLDTSSLVKLYFEEEGSVEVRALADEADIVSTLTHKVAIFLFLTIHSSPTVLQNSPGAKKGFAQILPEPFGPTNTVSGFRSTSTSRSTLKFRMDSLSIMVQPLGPAGVL